MPQNSPPAAPNPNKLYKQGIQTYLQFQPQLLAAEQAARKLYDPQRIQAQQALQQQYGPTQYSQQLSALQQIDPVGTALRTQVGNAVSSDLALGGQLSPEMEKQLESEIRGAETARGNVLGNAPAEAEDLFKGQAALSLYQQRLQNAGAFLSSPTPEQQLLTVQPVAPDRSSAYVNPNAGYQGQQFGLQNYQNLLAQYQLSSGGGLGGALSGAASGAIGGAAFGEPWGSLAGGLIGGTVGYFSDKRLKERIKTLYKDAISTVKAFRYKGDPAKQMYVGRMAQDIKKTLPDAVGESDGFLTVGPEFAPVPV
jgi:Glycine zipper